MTDLTEEARNEIRAAIAIIREDKFEQYARTTLAKHAPKDEPPPPEPPKVDPPVPPAPPVPPTPPPGPTPPPPKPVDEPPKVDPPAKRKHSYWGELDD